MKKFLFSLLILIIILISIIFSFNFFEQKSKLIVTYGPSPLKDYVNIAFITDELNYLSTKIAIKSAIKNKNPKTKYFIHIIGINLDDKKVKDLSLLAQKSVIIFVINQDNIYEIYKNKLIQRDLFKFNLHEIFLNYNKILFLNSDILILKDLSDIYNTQLGKNYAAVVKNYYNSALDEQMNMPRYFDDGIMVLNLEKMRNNNVLRKLFSSFKTSKKLFIQSAFNTTFYPNIVWLNKYTSIKLTDIEKHPQKIFEDYYEIPTKNNQKAEILKRFHIIQISDNMKYRNDLNNELNQEWIKYLSTEEKAMMKVR